MKYYISKTISGSAIEFRICPERRTPQGTNPAPNEKRKHSAGTQLPYDVEREIDHLMQTMTLIYEQGIQGIREYRKRLRYMFVLSVSYFLIWYYSYRLLLLHPWGFLEEWVTKELVDDRGRLLMAYMAPLVGLYILLGITRAYQFVYHMRERFTLIDHELGRYLRTTFMRFDSELYQTTRSQAGAARVFAYGPKVMETVLVFGLALLAFAHAISSTLQNVEIIENSVLRGFLVVAYVVVVLAILFIGRCFLHIYKENARLVALTRHGLVAAGKERKEQRKHQGSHVLDFVERREEELSSLYDKLASC